MKTSSIINTWGESELTLQKIDKEIDRDHTPYEGNAEIQHNCTNTKPQFTPKQVDATSICPKHLDYENKLYRKPGLPTRKTALIGTLPKMDKG